MWWRATQVEGFEKMQEQRIRTEYKKIQYMKTEQKEKIPCMKTEQEKKM